MPYDEDLAARIREIVAGEPPTASGTDCTASLTGPGRDQAGNGAGDTAHSVSQAGLPWAALSAGPAGMREDDRAQPQILLHIACQAGGQILAAPPTHYLCGAPVRLLLTRITPGDGPDGPGVCPICAALDHPGRLTRQTGKTNISRTRPTPASSPTEKADAKTSHLRGFRSLDRESRLGYQWLP